MFIRFRDKQIKSEKKMVIFTQKPIFEQILVKDSPQIEQKKIFTGNIHFL